MASFTVVDRGSRVAVTLAGAVTVRHAAALAEALRERLNPAVDLVEIDASALERADSSILQLIVAVQNSGYRVQAIAAADNLAACADRYGLRRPLSAALGE